MNRLQRGILLASFLVAGAVALPLGILVRDRWGPLRRADNRIEDALDLPTGLARDVALGVTQLGAPLLLELIALVVALAFFWRRRRRLTGYVLATVFGAEVLSYLLKGVIARLRPCIDMASCPDTTSFPSGHAAGAAAFWAMAAVLLLPVWKRRAWWLLIIPVLVALTRVLLGVHYPSDVVAGLMVGGCWAAACTAVFAAWRDERAGRDVPLEEGLEEGPEEGTA